MNALSGLAAIEQRIAVLDSPDADRAAFERALQAERAAAPIVAPPQPSPSSSMDALEPLISAAATRYSVDPALVRAVVACESGGDARATSAAGAMGLMQLMPQTAASMGVRDAYDGMQNVDGGTRYLRLLLDRFGGNVPRAVAAYNAGPGAVDRYDGVPPFAETQRYVANVLTNFTAQRR